MCWLPRLLLLAHVPALASTVVVLPFFNLSQNPKLDWISESVAETVREALANEGVLVLERDARLEAYERAGVRQTGPLTKATVVKLAEALDAGQAVYGQFHVSGGEGDMAKATLRLRMRILDIRHLRQSPEVSELGALADLPALQNNLAWQAVRHLLGPAAPDAESFARRYPAIRVDAVEQYVRGLLASAADQKHRFFTNAARLDPRFSQPCFELGRMHWRQQAYAAAREWLQRVPSTDPHFREALFLLGLVRFQLADYAAAQSAFQEVAAAVPLSEVQNNLGAALSRLEQLNAALEHFTKALEGDSADPDYHFNVGYVLWKSGRFDEAADRFRAALERDPEDQESTLLLGKCLKRVPRKPGDVRSEQRERLKKEYDESAWRQLKAVLGPRG